MSAKRNGRVQRSESDWRTILGRFDRSGLSPAAFCRETGISPSTFQVWERKLRRRAPALGVRRRDPGPQPSSHWGVESEFPNRTPARVRS